VPPIQGPKLGPRLGTVWITRTPEGAKRTARSVEALGFETLVVPVLKVRALRPLIDPHSFDAIIVTSRNGLNAYCELCSRRSITVWCVGDATAEAARAKKFQTVLSAEGDVNALLALVLAKADTSTRLLYIAPKDPAAPLAETLRDKGFQIKEAAVYETVPSLTGLAPKDASRLSHILIHSPKAARAIAPILMAQKDRLDLNALEFLCISEAAAQALEDAWNQVIKNNSPHELVKRISKFPDEASLLMLLAET